ncbi:hypothetical protein ZWY2020_052579 [Hordeum vulgare]|nr:hypothetical protein ZWY2020_052579 [Hordeum vulgare]
MTICPQRRAHRRDQIMRHTPEISSTVSQDAAPEPSVDVCPHTAAHLCKGDLSPRGNAAACDEDGGSSANSPLTFSPLPSTANPTTPSAYHLPSLTKPQPAGATFCLLTDPATAEPSDYNAADN